MSRLANSGCPRRYVISRNDENEGRRAGQAFEIRCQRRRRFRSRIGIRMACGRAIITPPKMAAKAAPNNIASIAASAVDFVNPVCLIHMGAEACACNGRRHQNSGVNGSIERMWNPLSSGKRAAKRSRAFFSSGAQMMYRRPCRQDSSAVRASFELTLTA